MKVSTVGIDLAKNVFQIHGVDEKGKTMLTKRLSRMKFLPFLAQLPPCLIGMEACGSSHHFARVLSGYGHEVKLIPPQYVKPFVKRNKTDAADAEAICEAVTRPNMRFVPVKSIDQQAVQALHTERDLLVSHATALSNSMRGILMEFGECIPTGFSSLYTYVEELLADETGRLPRLLRASITRQFTRLHELKGEIKLIEVELKTWGAAQEDCQRLQTIPGVGPLTATALISSIGNGSQFKKAKDFVGWLGLCPREHSSGGKQRLGGISKQGNTYCRTLLTHGARSLAYRAGADKPHTAWLYNLLCRKHHNVAVVAQAAKTARIIWSVLRHGTEYHAPTVADSE